jgi:hypothetical protein
LIPDPSSFYPTRWYRDGNGEGRVVANYLGDTPLTTPFFHDAVEAARRRYGDVAPVEWRPADVERLAELAGEPTGFIFHMSRCGSTLLSRMLAALERAIVISEPHAVNDLLMPTAQVDVVERSRWLRRLVGAFDKRRSRRAEWFFIKFSSWNVLEVETILAAFRHTPACFVFRDPVEVMVSVLNQPPGWMRWKTEAVLGPYVVGTAHDEVARLTDEEYCARALGRFCQLALAVGAERVRPLEYAELPAAAFTTIPRLFGLELTLAEIDRMHRTAQFDAKDAAGTRPFVADSLAKRQKASDSMRRLACEWAKPSFVRLRATAIDNE